MKEEKGKTKIVFVQGVITQGELDKLKDRTGEESTKDAVNAALSSYLNAQGTISQGVLDRLKAATGQTQTRDGVINAALEAYLNAA